NEEIGGLLGTEYLVKDEIVKGDACLLGDVCCDYPIAYLGGTMQISFIIKGIRRNAQAYPDLPPPNRNNYSGINAIKKMVKIMNFLMNLQEEFKQMETKYPIPPDLPSKIGSVNFTKVNGGTSVSATPDNCILQCLINVIPEMDLEGIKTRILNFVWDGCDWEYDEIFHQVLKNHENEMRDVLQIPLDKNLTISDMKKYLLTHKLSNLDKSPLIRSEKVL
ncbi:unnamed protein product, partial [marine sediment metagenome]